MGGEVAEELELADWFTELLCERSGNDLGNWLAEAEGAVCPELRAFAAGIRRGEAVVRVATTSLGVLAKLRAKWGV